MGRKKVIAFNTDRSGGESGIRTHVRVSPKHAFQACAFSHSAISPPPRRAKTGLAGDPGRRREKRLREFYQLPWNQDGSAENWELRTVPQLSSPSPICCER